MLARPWPEHPFTKVYKNIYTFNIHMYIFLNYFDITYSNCSNSPNNIRECCLKLSIMYPFVAVFYIQKHSYVGTLHTVELRL